MGFLIAAALITGGVIWAATRKPSGGAVAAAAPARVQPVDFQDLEGMRQELEKGFKAKAGVTWTALGNVFVDDAVVRVDLSMLTPADARKILSIIPPGIDFRGRKFVWQLPKAPVPAAKVGSDLEVGGLNDGLDEIGGGDWGQP